RYFRYAGVTITSILENNRDQSFVFHVLAPDVPEAVRQKYQALEQRYGTQIVFHLIDEDRFAEYYQFSRHSQYS
ncbi:glycosyltransferase, partial [Escherichia coli]|uniref:glycosyltransferase n=3 Tax=Pseudomonadota TaxID=1224 RepID=UPI0039E0A5AE